MSAVRHAWERVGALLKITKNVDFGARIVQRRNANYAGCAGGEKADCRALTPGRDGKSAWLRTLMIGFGSGGFGAFVFRIGITWPALTGGCFQLSSNNFRYKPWNPNISESFQTFLKRWKNPNFSWFWEFERFLERFVMEMNFAKRCLGNFANFEKMFKFCSSFYT